MCVLRGFFSAVFVCLEFGILLSLFVRVTWCYVWKSVWFFPGVNRVSSSFCCFCY